MLNMQIQNSNRNLNHQNAILKKVWNAEEWSLKWNNQFCAITVLIEVHLNRYAFSCHPLNLRVTDMSHYKDKGRSISVQGKKWHVLETVLKWAWWKGCTWCKHIISAIPIILIHFVNHLNYTYFCIPFYLHTLQVNMPEDTYWLIYSAIPH